MDIRILERGKVNNYYEIWGSVLLRAEFLPDHVFWNLENSYSQGILLDARETQIHKLILLCPSGKSIWLKILRARALNFCVL